MEQKTEASQAVDELLPCPLCASQPTLLVRAIACDSCLCELGRSKGQSDTDLAMEWNRRVALRVQPAPTEAWTKQAPTVQADYWHWNGDEDAAPSIVSVLYSGSARKCFVTMNCTYSGQAEMCDKYGGWWMRIEQPGLPGNEAQPSGNTGELMQGWDVDDLISNMGIEKEVAKARAELQADPAIIPSLLAVQGEDRARLECAHANGRTASWDWITCDDCGAIYTGPGEREWGVAQNMWFKNGAEAKFYKENGRYPDRARASAETGGVKP